jgi:DNA-binding transcriptional ArsR family regulator
MAALPRHDRVADTVELLSLLSNATRLNILLALQSRRSEPDPELCVCDLAAVARASKSMTSHQLRLLRTFGIVHQRRSGRLMYYRLANDAVAQLVDRVAALARAVVDRAAARSDRPLVGARNRSGG